LAPRGTNAKWEGHPCSFAWVDILAMSEVKTFWEKKGLHPKMEPYESGGKRTREEETPSAVGPNRGRRIRFDPCRWSAGPREEGAVRRLIDQTNMLGRDRSRNVDAGMPAMHCARGRSVRLTQFRRTCLRSNRCKYERISYHAQKFARRTHARRRACP
jgi:hypothetical protein